MGRFGGRASVILCLGFGSLAAAAPQRGSALDEFLTGLNSLRAEFTQQLNDNKGRKLAAAHGRLTVRRPGRLRWEISPGSASSGPRDYAQLLVADGLNLWYYDRDLAQVTVKPAAAALTATPAMLLAGGSDWRTQFDLKPLPDGAGLQWVEVRPKKRDAEFRSARLGFAGLALKRMVLTDSLGQTANVEFSAWQRNLPVADHEVSFVPPPGVDVIGKPIAPTLKP